MGFFDFLKGNNNAPKDKVQPPPVQRNLLEVPDYPKGTKLGDQYVIRGILGRGGFGVVYSAIDQHSGKPVAVKALRIFGNEEQNKDFEAELKIWLGLGSHPFIVSLNHVLYHAGRLHAVMEHVAASDDGAVSLHDMIIAGAVLTDQVIGNYCIQFCTAMEYATKKGMRAHRDIKPMNLLIDAGSMLKISDFGLAWAAEKFGADLQLGDSRGHVQKIISLNGQITVGTLGFIAPEIMQGTSASIASDMFSFGVVLWQMACGRIELPYNVLPAANFQQFQQALLKAQTSRNWRKVPSIYWPIIERCLQPDPAQRYRDYFQLLKHIKELMREHGLKTVEYLTASHGHMRLIELINHGASLSLMGNHEEALKRLTEALREDSTLVAAWVNRGNVYSRMGEYNKALDDHQRAIELDPNLPEALLARADDYISLGQYSLAFNDLKTYRETRPNSTLGLCSMSKVLAHLNRPIEGLEVVQQAYALDPENSLVLRTLGELNLALNRADEALTWIKKALATHPDSLKSQVVMLKSLYAKKDSAGMRAQVAIVQDLFADDMAALNNIGIGLSELGLYEAAISTFKLALKQSSSSTREAILIANIGIAYGDASQTSKAIEYLDASIKLDPEYFLAHLSKARILYEAGDFANAESVYAHASNLDRHSVSALMGLSACALHNNKHLVATEALKNILVLDPNNLQARYNLAAAQVHASQFDQAVETLNQIVRIDETYARAWYLKAQILKKLKRNLDAWNASVQACKYVSNLSKDEADNALRLMNELTDAPI